MSQRKLLIGDVKFKKGKTYDEVKEAIHYFCKYSGVDETNIIEQYNDFLKNAPHSTNGSHIVIRNYTIELVIVIRDIDSNIDESTTNTLGHIVAKYKDLIDIVSFSLNYFNTSEIILYYDDKYDNNKDDIKELETADVGRYYEELVKDGIIDVRKLMLYTLKEKEEEDD